MVQTAVAREAKQLKTLEREARRLKQATLKASEPKSKTTSINTVSIAGFSLRDTCDHVLIPGLDAQFCQTCQIYWVDLHMIEQLMRRK